MENLNLLVGNIFKVFYFIIQLQDDSINNHTDFRKAFLKEYESMLNEIITIYLDILNRKPQSKLDSKELLKKPYQQLIQAFIDELTLAGTAIELIKGQLIRSKIGERRKPAEGGP